MKKLTIEVSDELKQAWPQFRGSRSLCYGKKYSLQRRAVETYRGVYSFVSLEIYNRLHQGNAGYSGYSTGL